MRVHLLALLSPGLVAAAASFGDAVVIDHEAVACVVAERFPEIEARLAPAAAVVHARVRFRPEGGPYWYSVPLAPRGERFVAVLPKPRRQLAAFDYYIEVVAADLSVTRAPDARASVVAGPLACRDEVVAGSLARAVVDLEVPPGAPAVPPGFGVSAIGAAAGAAGTSTGLAVAGVAAGAAAAGVAVAGGAAGGTPGPAPSGAPPTAPPPGPPPTTGPPSGTLSGHWAGFCDLREETPNGMCVQALMLVAELTQAGGSLTGSLVATMTASTGPCQSHAGDVFAGTVTGTVQGDRVGLEARDPGDWMVLSGTVVGTSMGGAVTATSSNATGTWRLDR